MCKFMGYEFLICESTLKCKNLAQVFLSNFVLFFFLLSNFVCYPTNASENPILIPGQGSEKTVGSFQNSVSFGNEPGFDAKVIARWNVVPFQTFSKKTSVGILAFHINGIDRVEFSLGGGPVLVVREKSLNRRTNTYEYLVDVAPLVYSRMGFPDGPVAIRALVYPRTSGIPRILEPLTININGRNNLMKAVVWASEMGDDKMGDGTKEKPFRQPFRALLSVQTVAGKGRSADGAVVYLTPGNYEWGSSKGPSPMTKNRWLTITAAPGVSRSKVVINKASKGGFRTKLVHIKNITVKNISLTTTNRDGRYLWIDKSTLLGPGKYKKKTAYYSSMWKGIFITNSKISEYRDGAVGASIVRNVDVENIGSDAFSNSKLVVNSRANGIDRGNSGFHPDVFQIYCGEKATENIILYGIEVRNAAAQGIFSRGCTSVDNVAIVNVLIARPLDSKPNSPFFSQWITPTNHLLMYGLSLPNSVFLWRSSEMKNISVRASIFYKMLKSRMNKSPPPIVEKTWFNDNHFMNVWTKGSISIGKGKSVGNPRFANAKEGNFRPSPDSPLKNRLAIPIDIVDARMNNREISGTIGALE